MQINVRLSAGMSQLIGNPRLIVTLPNEATVADLLKQLRSQYPVLEEKLTSAIPMISGRHVAQSERLTSDIEVALLLPVAGGSGAAGPQ